MFNAGDVKAWKLCTRRVWFDHNPPPGLVPEEDAFEALVKSAGEVHEAQVRATLGVESVPARSVAHTAELMAAGVAAIYQPAFEDQQRGIRGRPDFLLRTADGSYQVADAKLAIDLKRHPDLKIQLGLYRELAGSELPARVFLGGGGQDEVGDEITPQVQQFVAQMQSLMALRAPPEAHFGESKCGACPYSPVCRPAFEKAGALTLTYGVDPRSVPGLRAQGVASIHDLAQADPALLTDVPYLKGREKKVRAVAQAASLVDGRIRQLKPLHLPDGDWVHFDVESDPLSANMQGRVYLWGFLPPGYATKHFAYAWSDGGDDSDEAAWLGFLQQVDDFADRFAQLVLAHYSPYEVTQVRTGARRYGCEQHPVVRWLLGPDTPLFDMAPVVRKCLVLPLTGYGLKAVCKHPRLVNFQWQLSESGSQWSVVRYRDFLSSTDAAQREGIKQEILTYNRDDVRATRALEVWLRSQPGERPR